MPRLESFIQWQKENPATRTVDIDINKDGVKIWVYDTAIWQGQFVESVADINLEGEEERKEKAEFERLRAKYEGQGNG